MSIGVSGVCVHIVTKLRPLQLWCRISCNLVSDRLNVTGIDPFDSSLSHSHNIAELKYKSQVVHCKALKSFCKSFYVFGQPFVGYRKYDGR